MAVLALFGGAFLPTGLVGVVSDSGKVAEALVGLRDRALVDQADDRFGLPARRRAIASCSSATSTWQRRCGTSSAGSAAGTPVVRYHCPP